MPAMARALPFPYSTVARCLVVAFAIAPTAARAQVIYTITDLGTIPAGSQPPGSVGYGINSSGQVSGATRGNVGLNHAFRTTPTGRVTDPGADLGGVSGG